MCTRPIKKTQGANIVRFSATWRYTQLSLCRGAEKTVERAPKLAAEHLFCSDTLTAAASFETALSAIDSACR